MCEAFVKLIIIIFVIFYEHLQPFCAAVPGLWVVCCPCMGCPEGNSMCCMLAAGGDLGNGMVAVTWRLWILEGGTFLARRGGGEMDIVSANLTFCLYY